MLEILSVCTFPDFTYASFRKKKKQSVGGGCLQKKHLFLIWGRPTHLLVPLIINNC
jgi:hypothetical protein